MRQDAALASRRKARGKGGERRGEMTLQERYSDVRDFWARLPLARRRSLLRVPIRRLLEGARARPSRRPLPRRDSRLPASAPPGPLFERQAERARPVPRAPGAAGPRASTKRAPASAGRLRPEAGRPSARRARPRAGIKREHGAAVAGEVEEGLELLRDAGNARACYWACPFCAEAADGAPRRFGSARAFLVHVDACHEGVQLSADGVPLLCVECSNEARRPRRTPRHPSSRPHAPLAPRADEPAP